MLQHQLHDLAIPGGGARLPPRTRALEPLHRPLDRALTATDAPRDVDHANASNAQLPDAVPIRFGDVQRAAGADTPGKVATRRLRRNERSRGDDSVFSCTGDRGSVPPATSLGPRQLRRAAVRAGGRARQAAAGVWGGAAGVDRRTEFSTRSIKSRYASSLPGRPAFGRGRPCRLPPRGAGTSRDRPCVTAPRRSHVRSTSSGSAGATAALLPMIAPAADLHDLAAAAASKPPGLVHHRRPGACNQCR